MRYPRLKPVGIDTYMHRVAASPQPPVPPRRRPFGPG